MQTALELRRGREAKQKGTRKERIPRSSVKDTVERSYRKARSTFNPFATRSTRIVPLGHASNGIVPFSQLAAGSFGLRSSAQATSCEVEAQRRERFRCDDCGAQRGEPWRFGKDSCRQVQAHRNLRRAPPNTFTCRRQFLENTNTCMLARNAYLMHGIVKLRPRGIKARISWRRQLRCPFQPRSSWQTALHPPASPVHLDVRQ